jgi:hypothetical protein
VFKFVEEKFQAFDYRKCPASEGTHSAASHLGTFAAKAAEVFPGSSVPLPDTRILVEAVQKFLEAGRDFV